MMVIQSQLEIFSPENPSPSDENTAMDSLKNDTLLPTAKNNGSRVKKLAKKTKAAKSAKNKKDKK